MIDFACKRFELSEVLKCALGLRTAEYAVFERFLNKDTADKEHSAAEVAKRLAIDLTTAQRAVKKLHAAGVLERRQVNLEGGGYEFRYSLTSKRAVRQRIMAIVKHWSETVDHELAAWERK
jgi:predicted transcriptional regulator